MLRNSLRMGSGVVERQRAGLRLPEQLDHHRHLHRAGGVERLVGIDQHLRPAVERLEGDGDFRAARGDERAQLRLERWLRRDDGKQRARLRSRSSLRQHLSHCT